MSSKTIRGSGCGCGCGFPRSLRTGRRRRRSRRQSGHEPAAAAAMADRRSSITYVTGAQLITLRNPNLAVVDVRDDERGYDGHIAGSMHFCSSEFEEKLPELVEKIKGKDTVVFHCAKSQVRGPSCARMLTEHLNSAGNEGVLEKVPNIVVLERGFDNWAASGRPVCFCQGLICTHSP